MRPACVLAFAALAIAPGLAACGDDGADQDEVDAAAGAVDAAATVDSAPGAADAAAATVDAAPARAVETRSFDLAAGVFAEAAFTAGPGDSVLVELSADGPVIAWNIHGHAAGGTQIVEEGNDVEAVRYTFVPTEDAEWFVLFGNSGTGTQTISATLSFYGDATFVEWE